MKILVVEDDSNLAYLLDEHLRSKQLDASVCATGGKALMKLRSEKFNLCLLDIVLPDIDGLTLAKKIRDEHKELPIVFLTSRNLKSDLQSGYAAGCDDYITKPFDSDLLVLKIKAILKRCYEEPLQEQAVLSAGNHQLNILERKLKSNHDCVRLSAKESEIMSVLFKHYGMPVSRDKIMQDVWGRSDYFISKNLDVFLTRIRKILKEKTNLYLETIHAFGYVLRVAE